MQHETAGLWPDVMSRLRSQVGPGEFDNWFGTVRLESWENGVVVVSVAEIRRMEWLETYYLERIEQACADASGSATRVRLVVRQGGRNGTTPTGEGKGPQAAGANGKRNGAWADAHADAAGQGVSGVHVVGAATSLDESMMEGGPHTVEINPRYHFGNFVQGGSNKLAFSVAYAVAEQPSRNYNPLFIHSSTGLGKTHLLQSIGNHIKSTHPHLTVIYLQAESFVNEVIDATRQNAWPRFHARFRNVDVLLIDDIHFLAGKEGSQDQFFHTFNALHNAHKQIVMTSDRPPRDVPTLADRLRSRFGWGLIVDITPPDLETRVAILRQKSRELKVALHDEVLHFVANKFPLSVRDLESALIKLAAVSFYNNVPIKVDTAARLLKDLIARDDRQISIDKILEIVSKQYRVKVSELLGGRRTRNIALPRRVAMYLARRLTAHSYPEIGALMGNKDHSTIMHACRRVEDEIAENDTMRVTIDRLIADLGLRYNGPHD